MLRHICNIDNYFLKERHKTINLTSVHVKISNLNHLFFIISGKQYNKICHF